MQKGMSVSLLIAVTCLTIGFAGRRDRDVDRALKKEYPDATTEVRGSRLINGVKVYDVKVVTKHGESTAQVTEYGDFVLTGRPRGDNNISRPAMETLNGLFHSGQKDVDVYHVTNYLVDVKTDRKPFRLRFDSVGTLKDVINDAEMRKDDVHNFERVNDKSHNVRADDYAKRYLEGDKIDAVYRDPNLEDFFIVDMRQRDGKDARITLNNDGRVFSEREEIDANDLPKPVQETLDQTFDRTRITHAYRYEYEYYQFDKTSSAGDHVSIQIRPNGDVLKVTNEGQELRGRGDTR